jgi:hypothetical protein
VLFAIVEQLLRMRPSWICRCTATGACAAASADRTSSTSELSAAQKDLVMEAFGRRAFVGKKRASRWRRRTLQSDDNLRVVI